MEKYYKAYAVSNHVQFCPHLQNISEENVILCLECSYVSTGMCSPLHISIYLFPKENSPSYVIYS